MTLKQAFTQWAAIPDNKVLAAKNRTNMQKVLLEKHGSMDVTLIDRHFMDIVLKDCKADHRAQVNACSVLCHVLTWLHGNDPKTYPAPDFDYNIASTKPTEQPAKVAKPKVKSVEKPKVEVSESKSQAPAQDDTEDPLQGIDFSDEKENLNHISVMQENNTTVKKPGKAPIPVAQLDPKTLAVIKIWTSRSEAERETGACNLDRAVKNARLAAGFFWCSPENTETFKPNPKTKVVKREKKTVTDGQYLRRPVVQIDTTTLKEVARFDTAKAAEKALGIKNVLRAIDRCGISGGFHWAFADEFNADWHPVKRERGYRRVVPQTVINAHKATAQKKTRVIKKQTVSAAPSPTLPEKQREFLSQISDEILLEEIRSRVNWHGTVSIDVTTTINETL